MRWFRQLDLASKLQSVLAAVVLALLAQGVVVWQAAHQSSAAWQDVAVWDAAQVDLYQASMRRLELLTLARVSPGRREALGAAESRLLAAVQRTPKELRGPVVAAITEAAEGMRAGRPSEAALGGIEDALQAALGRVGALRAEAEGRALAADQAVQTATVVGGIAIALLFAVGAALLYWGVGLPLRSLRARVDALANGAVLPALPVDIAGQDEVGRLARGIDSVAHTVQTVVDQTSALAKGALDDAALETHLPGEVGDALHSLVERVRGTSRSLEAISAGDYDLDVQQQSAADQFGRALGRLQVALRDKEAELADRDLRRDLISRHQAFESQLSRALDMVRTEEDTLEIVQRVLSQRAPGTPAQLMMADEDREVLEERLATVSPGQGCQVTAPDECPAVRRGQTMVFDSSDSIDACPFMRGRPGGACSAVCVPVSIMGQTVGVLHASGRDGKVPPKSRVEVLETLSSRVGERVSVLRAFAKSEAAAATDPLTGLLNRRSVESRIRALAARDQSFAICYGDLDRFKLLNDTYGHDAGDKALQTFATVLEDALRPTDVVGRWGGEEFLAILPGANAEQARTALNRVRDRLRSATAVGGVSVTVSFGVADTTQGSSWRDLIHLADTALLAAKRNGRDRIVLVGEDPTLPPPAAQGDQAAGEAEAVLDADVAVQEDAAVAEEGGPADTLLEATALAVLGDDVAVVAGSATEEC